MMKGLDGKPYEEWLRSLGVFSLERSLKGDIITVYNILMRRSGGANADLFTLVTSERTQANGMKLSQRRFSLDIRNRFFTQRVVGHWNRLPRDVVKAPSLTEFKCLNDILGHMV
ncbi:hypothetical protein WISP_92722 [Willisornis vidua]|uniref:Uncharacterized protein n=1 Tax=Willisornis vidua TaxID=1566151 RepID=A0ABQ9D6W4_9PASS|nr:hypothetical protein WISP_92722 [Willisornis vidua]